jgi:bifunctional non-homologous end joining protein LigD
VVELSHPDKLLFPADGVTKADLAAHYETVAEVMLPHVRDRPVSMQVFPGGIERPGHFMKQAPDYFPEWARRVTVPKKGGEVTHVVADDPQTLRLLANHNCITPHVFTSRADRLNRPDRLVVDLDPSQDDFARVREAARMVGGMFRDVGLEPFAMVTGSRGIHVVAPIRRELDFPDVFALSKAIAEAAVERSPDRLTLAFYKEKRDDRIFVDVLRNRWAQTVVPPYAVRPRPGAPVAVPIAWDELDDDSLAPNGWTVRTIGERLGRLGDPWADIADAAASPRGARRRLEA